MTSENARTRRALGEAGRAGERGQNSTTACAAAYIDAGLALVPIPMGGKRPTGVNWNTRERVITTHDQAARLTGGGIGLAHLFSRTCAIDVDAFHEAESWLAERGIDLTALLCADDAVQIRSGRPNRAKLIYRLPESVDWLPTCKTAPYQTDGQKTAQALELRCAKADGSATVQDVLPPSIHPDTGKPYEWHGDWRNLPELPESLLSLWLTIAGQHASTATTPQSSHSGVIGRFNAEHDPGEILERNGYRPAGTRWLSPDSTSGTPGIVRLPDSNPPRVYSHHGDALATGHSHDAFSIYTVLEHGGDASAAVKAASSDSVEDRTDAFLGVDNRTETEILAEAKALTEDTDSEAIAALIQEAATLSPVGKRRVHSAIKKATGMPLSTIREQERDGKDAPDEPDHLALARSVVSSEGAENIIGTQAHVWRYQGTGVWRPLEARAEKQIVQTHLDDAHEDESISRALVESVTDLFRTEVYRPSHEWDVGPPDAVCTPNGEVQLQVQGGQWVLTDHRRDYYRTVQIPVEFDPNATAERFMQFLSEIFEGDSDAVDKATTLLEMIGYSLMAHTRFERFVILVGAGANGKSVLLALIEALLGRDNVAGVQPCHFDRSFQRAHLHLKLANIVTEIREGEVIADAELKSIVSGEPTTVEHKFRDPFEMRPYATCWFGTNHMPHTRDFSDALFRRALVVPFNRKFVPGRDADPKLKDKLLAELPGVLNMALNAYAGVLQRGYFTEPDSCIEAKREWRLNADQAAQFIEERCTSGPGETPSSELFEAYREWARDAGVHHTLTHKTFSERAERLGYQKRHTRAGNVFDGLRIKEAAAADYRALRDGL